jgi:hypothetical protein
METADRLDRRVRQLWAALRLGLAAACSQENGAPFVKGGGTHPCSRHNSGTGMLPSAWREMARICGSRNLLVFIKISSIILPRRFYF